MLRSPLPEYMAATTSPRWPLEDVKEELSVFETNAVTSPRSADPLVVLQVGRLFPAS